MNEELEVRKGSIVGRVRRRKKRRRGRQSLGKCSNGEGSRNVKGENRNVR